MMHQQSLPGPKNNQNSLVRIPVTRGEGIRVELRSPDTSANPYVVLAICLAAGLDGIKNKITPTKSSNLETKGQQAEHLPSTLKEAIDYFEESSWVKEVLGEEFCDQYITAKKMNGLDIPGRLLTGKLQNICIACKHVAL